MKPGSLIFMFFIGFLFYFYYNANLFGQTINPEIPMPIKNSLDKEYPGWYLAEVGIEIYEFFKRSNLEFYPNYIYGDFDGNGMLDYSLMITYCDSNYVIAFLKNKQGFKKYVLDSHDKNYKDIYLWLFKKCEKDYNYDIEKEFTYKTDAIGVMCYEKCGLSFIYKKGKFNPICTSD